MWRGDLGAIFGFGEEARGSIARKRPDSQGVRLRHPAPPGRTCRRSASTPPCSTAARSLRSCSASPGSWRRGGQSVRGRAGGCEWRSARRCWSCPQGSPGKVARWPPSRADAFGRPSGRRGRCGSPKGQQRARRGGTARTLLSVQSRRLLQKMKLTISADKSFFRDSYGGGWRVQDTARDPF